MAPFFEIGATSTMALTKDLAATIGEHVATYVGDKTALEEKIAELEFDLRYPCIFSPCCPSLDSIMYGDRGRAVSDDHVVRLMLIKFEDEEEGTGLTAAVPCQAGDEFGSRAVPGGSRTGSDYSSDPLSMKSLANAINAFVEDSYELTSLNLPDVEVRYTVTLDVDPEGLLPTKSYLFPTIHAPAAILLPYLNDCGNIWRVLSAARDVSESATCMHVQSRWHTRRGIRYTPSQRHGLFTYTLPITSFTLDPSGYAGGRGV